MYRKSKNTFYCFSPPVMIATMVIEVCLALYTVWRYKMTQVVRLATVTLLMLASFQLAEFFVCTGSVGHAVMWSRIGFAAITTLPVIGLHLMHKVAGKSNPALIGAAYVSMAAFIVFFLVFPSVFVNYQCTGNYVIFQLHHNVGGFYWLFYMGWLLTAILLGARWTNELMKKGKKRHLNAVRGLIIGWLTFLVPTAIANMVNPASRDGIPSVMCGFAVLFALILTMYVLPRIAKAKTLTNNKHKLSYK